MDCLVCLLTLLWTHAEVHVLADVERKHYDEILHCSFRKSREFVLFSVTTKKVQSPKDNWLACPPISVSSDYQSFFFIGYLGE